MKQPELRIKATAQLRDPLCWCDCRDALMDPAASDGGPATSMTNKKILIIFGVMALIVSLPFGLIHLLAAPDEAPLTALHRVTAALANYFGPWGVAIVRLVDFPNAGLRSFSWAAAAGLTLLGACLVLLPLKINKRPLQILFSVFWAIFLVVWFGVGLTQIASGLL